MKPISNLEKATKALRSAAANIDLTLFRQLATLQAELKEAKSTEIIQQIKEKIRNVILRRQSEIEGEIKNWEIFNKAQTNFHTTKEALYNFQTKYSKDLITELEPLLKKRLMQIGFTDQTRYLSFIAFLNSIITTGIRLEDLDPNHIDHIKEIAADKKYPIELVEKTALVTALEIISQNKNFKTYVTFCQSIPDAYFENDINTIAFGANAQNIPDLAALIPFVKESIAANTKEGKTEQDILKQLSATAPLPKSPLPQDSILKSLTNTNPLSLKQRSATTPTPVQPQPIQKLRGLTHLEIKSAVTLEAPPIKLATPFLNYRLNEIYAKKNINLNDDLKTRELVHQINQNTLSNQKAIGEIEKLGIKLSADEKKEVKRANKQIYYYSQIINPVIRQMLAGSYLKSTIKTKTLALIQNINKSVLKDDQDVKQLMQDLGITLSASQINDVQMKNADLRRKIPAETSLKNDDEKLKWLRQQEDIATDFKPGDFSSPSEMTLNSLNHFINNFIHDSAENFIVKERMWTESQSALNKVINKIFEGLTLFVNTHNERSEQKIDLKKAQDAWANYLNDLKNILIKTKRDISIAELIPAILKMSLGFSVPPKDAITFAINHLRSSDQSLFNAFYSTQFYAGNNAAYKILNDLIDNNINMDAHQWEMKLLLRSINVDSDRLVALANKLIARKKLDYLKELSVRNELPAASGFSLVKLKLEKKIEQDPLALVKGFLITQKNAFQKRQENITNQLDQIKVKGLLSPDQYDKFINGMHDEANSFDVVLASKKLNDVNAFAAKLADNDKTLFPQTNAAQKEVSLDKYDAILRAKKELAPEEINAQNKIVNPYDLVPSVVSTSNRNVNTRPMSPAPRADSPPPSPSAYGDIPTSLRSPYTVPEGIEPPLNPDTDATQTTSSNDVMSEDRIPTRAATQPQKPTKSPSPYDVMPEGVGENLASPPSSQPTSTEDENVSDSASLGASSTEEPTEQTNLDDEEEIIYKGEGQPQSPAQNADLIAPERNTVNTNAYGDLPKEDVSDSASLSTSSTIESTEQTNRDTETTTPVEEVQQVKQNAAPIPAATQPLEPKKSPYSNMPPVVGVDLASLPSSQPTSTEDENVSDNTSLSASSTVEPPEQTNLDDDEEKIIYTGEQQPTEQSNVSASVQPRNTVNTVVYGTIPQGTSAPQESNENVSDNAARKSSMALLLKTFKEMQKSAQLMKQTLREIGTVLNIPLDVTNVNVVKTPKQSFVSPATASHDGFFGDHRHPEQTRSTPPAASPTPTKK